MGLLERHSSQHRQSPFLMACMVTSLMVVLVVVSRLRCAYKADVIIGLLQRVTSFWSTRFCVATHEEIELPASLVVMMILVFAPAASVM